MLWLHQLNMVEDLLFSWVVLMVYSVSLRDERNVQLLANQMPFCWEVIKFNDALSHNVTVHLIFRRLLFNSRNSRNGDWRKHTVNPVIGLRGSEDIFAGNHRRPTKWLVYDDVLDSSGILTISDNKLVADKRDTCGICKA